MRERKATAQGSAPPREVFSSGAGARRANWACALGKKHTPATNKGASQRTMRRHSIGATTSNEQRNGTLVTKPGLPGPPIRPLSPAPPRISLVRLRGHARTPAAASPLLTRALAVDQQLCDKPHEH